jgi:hypothetical protein
MTISGSTVPADAVPVAPLLELKIAEAVRAFRHRSVP